MKYTAAMLAASAAVATAQVVYNETTNTFICPAYSPNGAFCAGDSLQTNIIIRCTNGIGQPGNCNNNLAGQPPQGVRYSPCFQTSPTAGNAACSKNCIIYYPGYQVRLPRCIPTSSTTSSSSTSTSTSSSSTTTPAQNTTTTIIPPPTTSSIPSNTTITTTTIFPPPPTTGTGTTIIPTNGTTTTVPPPRTTTTTLPDGSVTTVTLPPTKTPIGPTTSVSTGPPEFTGAADRNLVGGMAVGLGAAVVLLL